LGNKKQSTMQKNNYNNDVFTTTLINYYLVNINENIFYFREKSGIQNSLELLGKNKVSHQLESVKI